MYNKNYDKFSMLPENSNIITQSAMLSTRLNSSAETHFKVYHFKRVAGRINVQFYQKIIHKSLDFDYLIMFNILKLKTTTIQFVWIELRRVEFLDVSKFFLSPNFFCYIILC